MTKVSNLPSSEGDMLSIKCEHDEVQFPEIITGNFNIQMQDEKGSAPFIEVAIADDRSEPLQVDIEEFIIPDKLHKTPIKTEPKEEDCVFEASFDSIVEYKPSVFVSKVQRDLDCVSAISIPKKELSPSEASSENASQNCLDELPASSLNDLLVHSSDASNGSRTNVKEKDNEKDFAAETEEAGVSDTNDTNNSGIDHFKCCNCSKSFKNRGYLSRHLRTHAIKQQKKFRLIEERLTQHTSGQKPYNCNYCDKVFTRKHLLLKHSLIHSTDKPFECHLCNKKYLKQNYLQAHLKKHDVVRSFKCNVCEREFYFKTGLSAHLRTHQEKPYKCNDCGQAYYQKRALNSHSRVHEGIKPYKCEFCNKAFHQKSKLVCHRRIHTGEKPFECGFCDKAFRNTSNLNSHRRVHTGEKPYKCDSCDKDFPNYSTLAIHRLLHPDVRHYKCDFCEKAFLSKSRLIYHRRIHTSENLYKCDFCDKVFTQKDTLTVHLLTHTDNKCDQEFLQIGCLENHHRGLTSERPYKCDCCDKEFARISWFIKHRNMHKTQKSQACQVCGKVFSKNEIISHQAICYARTFLVKRTDFSESKKTYSRTKKIDLTTM